MDINKYYRTEELFLFRKNKIKVQEQPHVSNAEDMYNVFYDFWTIGEMGVTESFKVMYLNNQNYVQGIIEVSRGALNLCTVDPRVVFAGALQIGASKMVFAHNHPSCIFTPSFKDIDLTLSFKKGCDILAITLVDHLILTLEGYVSMKALKLF